LPLSVGPWRGEALRLDAESVAHAQLAGYCWRRYRHTLTGDVVSVLLVCGDFRPVAVHPPDVCYEGAGYEMMGQPVRRTLTPAAPAAPAAPSAPPAEFWMAQFHKPGAAVPGQLRIYWSWTAKGTWEAADNPRLAFAGSPVLYKLYVLSETIPTDGAPDRDPCKEFMDGWLPELQKTLFR
jgi:hypothetical protein